MSNIQLCILLFIINTYLSQINSESKLRLLRKKSTKKEGESKEESKILQTLYSDSYSNNYYYTTLYISDKQIKQTYMIDTGIATMSSPCSPCEYCGKHKTNYFDFSNKKVNTQLKCSSEICKLVPATSCMVKEKNIDKKTCSFYSQKSNGDGLRGYYLSNIVYFEQDQNLTTPNQKKIYRSYALPLGCSLGEYGKYKEMNADGVLGLNNEKGSFSSLLFNLKIINKNIFTLCLGLEGGYMSLGEIDTTYHASKKIDYIPLLNDSNYLINITGIQIGKNKRININVVGNIDSGVPFTFLPKYIYKALVKEFDQYCTDEKGNNKCGKFQIEEGLGYCASYEDRESLYKSVNENWPVLSLVLGTNIEYSWEPINYYYYYIRKNKRKACLGFLYHHSDKIILGSNFMHGYDIIFDRDQQLLGIVQADCSRRNIIYNTMKGIIQPPTPSKTTSEPALDKEIHKKEKEEKFDLGDNDNKEGVEFIKGGNKELERINDFKLINYILLVFSILVIVIVLLIVIIVLICKRKEISSYQNIIAEENKHLNNPQNIIPEENNELNIQQNNINENEETNDNKNKEEDPKVVEDNKVTNDDVQFLKNIMKKTHK